MIFLFTVDVYNMIIECIENTYIGLFLSIGFVSNDSHLYKNPLQYRNGLYMKAE